MFEDAVVSADGMMPVAGGKGACAVDGNGVAGSGARGTGASGTGASGTGGNGRTAGSGLATGSGIGALGSSFTDTNPRTAGCANGGTGAGGSSSAIARSDGIASAAITVKRMCVLRMVCTSLKLSQLASDFSRPALGLITYCENPTGPLT
jgi:hypothetical protein